jgi:hypothetical protein
VAVLLCCFIVGLFIVGFSNIIILLMIFLATTTLTFLLLVCAIFSLTSLAVVLPTNHNNRYVEENLPVCQGHKYRPVFNLSHVLDTLRQHDIDFHFWDPIHDNITISRTIDLIGQDFDRGNLLSVALSICDEYTKGELGSIDITARLRCVSPTLMTLRMTKVHAMSLVSRQYELYPYDEELYGLMMGYEGLEYDSVLTEDMIMQFGVGEDASKDKHQTHHGSDVHTSAKACIIGWPSLHAVLPALFSRRIEEVVVYSSLIDNVCVPDEHNDCSGPSSIQKHGTDYEDMQNIADALGKVVHYRSFHALLQDANATATSTNEDGMLPHCSVVQVHDDIREFSTEELIMQVPNLLRHLSYPQQRVMIIRLQILQEKIAKAPLNPLLPWRKMIDAGELDFKLSMSTTSSQILIPGVLYFPTDTYWICLSTDDPTESSFQIDTVYSDSERHYTVVSEIGDQLSVIEIGEYISHQLSKDSVCNNPTEKTFANDDNSNKSIPTVIFVITWTFPIFVENAFGLAEAMAEYYFTKQQQSDMKVQVYVAPDMNLNIYDYFQEDKNKLLIHVPISTVDDVTMFAKYSVIYNSEQTTYDKVFGTFTISRYMYLFHHKSTVIWSYNDLSTIYLREQVFANTVSENREREQRIAEVPFLYPQDRKEVLHKLFNHQEDNMVDLESYPNPTTRINSNSTIHHCIPTRMHHLNPLEQYYHKVGSETKPFFNSSKIEEIYDQEIKTHQYHRIAIFLGTCYERRRILLTKLESLFVLNLINKQEFRLFYSICQRVFSYEQDYYLQRARVIINIGSSDVSILETHRINNLLSMGKVVVSEVGVNMTAANLADYEDAIVLVPMINRNAHIAKMEDEDSLNNVETSLIEEQASNIFQIVLPMLADDTELRSRSQRGRALYLQKILPKHKMKLYEALDKTVDYFFSLVLDHTTRLED